MQALPHSLQTLVITHSKPHIDLALSNMKESRILIYDNTVNLISIPQNLHCLCYFITEPSAWLRTNFPKVPKKNQLALLNLSAIGPTYGFLKSFEGLTKLKTLKLTFSKKKHILDSFCGRQKHVSNFDKLYMLQDISLTSFKGKTISGFSSKHCNLRYLNLFMCGSLRSCPSVGDLFALEELSFDFCYKLEELPNLQQLTRLRKLNICSCWSIIAVPGLGNLVALEEFLASSCSSLVALPDMHKLTNLQKLEIEHEALQGGFNLLKLNKLLALRVCNWSGPPAFSNVVSLEDLRMCGSEEGIEMMPNLLNLARLQSVYIRSCSFKDVSCLGNLISLRSIWINGCRSLEILPDAHKLTRLETLQVLECPKVMVWAGVCRSKSLDTLSADQPRSGTAMALHSLLLDFVGFRELLDLSLFPELKDLRITSCRTFERLISTTPMTALERLQLYSCEELQEVPDLSHCKLLSYCQIYCCTKISIVTRDEIMKQCPGLKIDLSPTSVYFGQSFCKFFTFDTQKLAPKNNARQLTC